MQPATAWLTRPCSYRMATSHQRLMIATESLHASSLLSVAPATDVQAKVSDSYRALDAEPNISACSPGTALDNRLLHVLS